MFLYRHEATVLKAIVDEVEQKVNMKLPPPPTPNELQRPSNDTVDSPPTASFSVYTAPEFKYSAKPYDQSKLLDANIHGTVEADKKEADISEQEEKCMPQPQSNYEDATTVSFGSMFLYTTV